jgi:hypothetical protein
MSIFTSIAAILVAFKNWLVGAEQWIEGLLNSLVRDAQQLVPVVEQFLEKAQAFINSPEAATIEGLIPDGVGTEIASIANEVIAWILGELTAITPTLVVASVASSGVPQYANPDAVAKTAFQSVSQLSADGQTHFLSGYSTMLLQKLAPSGVNLSYEDSQLVQAVAKKAVLSTTTTS